MSFRKKLLMAYILIALLPLTFFVGVNYIQTRDALIVREMSILEAVADAKVIAIKNYIGDFRIEVSVAQDYYNIKKNLPILSKYHDNSDNPEFVTAKKQLDEQFGSWTEKRNDVVDVMLVAPDGHVVYTSNPRHQLEDIDKPLPDNGETFKNGKNGVYVSDLFIDKAIKSKPGILAAAPITDLKGIFAGLVVFEIDAQEFYALIQDTAGLRETGEIQIAELFSGKESASLTSEIIAHSGDRAVFLNPLRFDANAAFKREEIFDDQALKPAQMAVLGKSGKGVSIDYRGEKVLAVWRYIPSRNWGLVAKIDYSEVLTSINNTLMFSLLVLIILFAMVFAFSWFVSGVIARSVSETEEAKKQATDHLAEAKRLNNVMIDREIKMVELKEELRKYKKEL